MKKIILAFLLLCLFNIPIAFASSERVAVESDAPEDKIYEKEDTWLSVGLKSVSTANTQNLKSDGGFWLVSFEDKGYRLLEDYSAYTELKVVLKSKAIQVQTTDGTLLTKLENNMGLLSKVENARIVSDKEERMFTIGKKTYRDGVSFLIKEKGLMAVNRVLMEHYTQGVVPRELNQSHPLEALKAQAVIVRTFAMGNIYKHSSLGYQICDSSDCQVYGGVDGEQDGCTKACKETEKLILMYDGKPAGGYYFPNSSGYTMNSEDVWSATLGYARSVKDEFATGYTWNSSMTFDAIKEKLNKNGKNCNSIISVSVEKRLANGAVSSVLIKTDAGDYSYTKTGITSFFGLKSLFFYIGNSDYPKKGSTTYVSEALYSQAENIFHISDEVFVMGASETVQTSLKNLYRMAGAKVLSAFYAQKNASSNDVALSGTVYFTGYGSGHGVGLPQNSASAMAKAGNNFEQILKYYFTDVELTDNY